MINPELSSLATQLKTVGYPEDALIQLLQPDLQSRLLNEYTLYHDVYKQRLKAIVDLNSTLNYSYSPFTAILFEFCLGLGQFDANPSKLQMGFEIIDELTKLGFPCTEKTAYLYREILQDLRPISRGCVDGLKEVLSLHIDLQTAVTLGELIIQEGYSAHQTALRFKQMLTDGFSYFQTPRLFQIMTVNYQFDQAKELSSFHSIGYHINNMDHQLFLLKILIKDQNSTQRLKTILKFIEISNYLLSDIERLRFMCNYLEFFITHSRAQHESGANGNLTSSIFRKILPLASNLNKIFLNLNMLGFVVKNPEHHDLFFSTLSLPGIDKNNVKFDSIILELLFKWIIKKQIVIHHEEIIFASRNQLQQDQLIQRIFNRETKDLDEQTRTVLFTIIRRVAGYNNKKQDLAMLEYGPLDKTNSTYRLEKLMHYIVTHGPESIIFQETPLHQCELIFNENNKSLNLSLLFKNANLTHFSFQHHEHSSQHNVEVSNEQIFDKLGQCLEILLPKTHEFYLAHQKQLNTDGVFAKLHPVLIRALSYVTLDHYINVNALCRGHPLILEINSSGNIDRKLSYQQAALSSLILVTLTAEALNQLPLLWYDAEVYAVEKAILSKIDFTDIVTKEAYQDTLYKALNTNQITESEFESMTLQFDKLFPLLQNTHHTFRRERLFRPSLAETRAMGVVQSPSQISTSRIGPLKNSAYFGDEVISFRNVCSFWHVAPVSFHKHENEVLIPAGMQVAYMPAEHHDYMEAHLVSSPRFQQDNYWIDHALTYCHTHYFNQEYKDASDTRSIGSHIVHRPNHGGPHAYRLMLYLPHVISYLMLFAKDEQLKEFCRTMSSENKQYLKIAALFLVTGRESEIRCPDDPKHTDSIKYHGYKDQSRRNLLHYISQFPQCLSLGTSKNATEINLAEYGNEFNSEILSMCHYLDLPRCLGSQAYQNILRRIEVVACDAQKQALKNLIRYAIDLIKIHGDCLWVQFNELNDNQLENCADRDYQNCFGELSNNIFQLCEISNFVQPPKINADKPKTSLGHHSIFQPMPAGATPADVELMPTTLTKSTQNL